MTQLRGLLQDHHLLRAAFDDVRGSSPQSGTGASFSTLRLPRQQSLGSSIANLDHDKHASAGLRRGQGLEHIAGSPASSVEATDALIVSWSSKSFDR